MDCTSLPCLNTDQECMCFAYEDSTDPTKDQFCGHVTPDGRIVPCEAGCCNGGMGCPGQCRDAQPKRPDNTRFADKRLLPIFSERERLVAFENLFKFLVLLLLLSTVSLFIRG